MLRQALGICAVMALGACTSDRPGDAAVSGATERYVLTAPGGTIGTISSAERCGSTIYLGDFDGWIHRLSLTGGSPAPIRLDGLLPAALAVDCQRGHIWVVSPMPRGRGLRAVAIDGRSGQIAREWPIDTTCFPTTAATREDELFIGGECLTHHVDGKYARPEAERYYADKRIGVRVSLASGAVSAGLAPYDTSCFGAGACVGGAVAAFGSGWLAALPASARVAEYRGDGELVRTLDVVSPSFVSDGRKLLSSAGSEERVQWSVRNSLLHRVFALGDRIAVAHYVTVVPPGWTMGSGVRPQFNAHLTMFARDGGAFERDIALSELPVGADRESVFVVDYGPAGRQGAHDSVTLERVVLR